MDRLRVTGWKTLVIWECETVDVKKLARLRMAILRVATETHDRVC
jgi:G:T-mismatch repair DNA endonuclease (very short patch repair protein)